MAPQRRKLAALGQMDEDHKQPNKKPKGVISSFYSRRTSKSAPSVDNESVFNQKRLQTLFEEYAAPHDNQLIEPEGIERFCKDLHVQPEDIVMLVLAYKMEAKQMGYFTLKEWTKGLTDLQCDTIAKLRSKLDHLRSLLTDPNCFKAIFRYSFDFTKDKDQRSIDIDTAKLMLSLLLADRWPMFNAFHLFLEESKYKAINKDQWCNVLEFSRIILSDLSNYDEDGAWPVLLDEFVDWYRRTRC